MVTAHVQDEPVNSSSLAAEAMHAMKRTLVNMAKKENRGPVSESWNQIASHQIAKTISMDEQDEGCYILAFFSPG